MSSSQKSRSLGVFCPSCEDGRSFRQSSLHSSSRTQNSASTFLSPLGSHRLTFDLLTFRYSARLVHVCVLYSSTVQEGWTFTLSSSSDLEAGNSGFILRLEVRVWGLMCFSRYRSTKVTAEASAAAGGLRSVFSLLSLCGRRWDIPVTHDWGLPLMRLTQVFR